MGALAAKLCEVSLASQRRLAQECVASGQSVLTFCATKAREASRESLGQRPEVDLSLFGVPFFWGT